MLQRYSRRIDLTSLTPPAVNNRLRPPGYRPGHSLAPNCIVVPYGRSTISTTRSLHCVALAMLRTKTLLPAVTTNRGYKLFIRSTVIETDRRTSYTGFANHRNTLTEQEIERITPKTNGTQYSTNQLNKNYCKTTMKHNPLTMLASQLAASPRSLLSATFHTKYKVKRGYYQTDIAALHSKHL